MTTLRTYSPLDTYRKLNSELDRFFGSAGNETRGPWSPSADIAEDDKQYSITLELPSVAREDVKVTLENGVLTIHGERKFEKEVKEKKYHRIERAYGSFHRSFTLPDDAEAKKIDAQVKEGVLTVTIPKSEEAKPKSIEVKVG